MKTYYCTDACKVRVLSPAEPDDIATRIQRGPVLEERPRGPALQCTVCDRECRSRVYAYRRAHAEDGVVHFASHTMISEYHHPMCLDCYKLTCRLGKKTAHAFYMGLRSSALACACSWCSTTPRPQSS